MTGQDFSVTVLGAAVNDRRLSIWRKQQQS